MISPLHPVALARNRGRAPSVHQVNMQKIGRQPSSSRMQGQSNEIRDGDSDPTRHPSQRMCGCRGVVKHAACCADIGRRFRKMETCDEKHVNCTRQTSTWNGR